MKNKGRLQVFSGQCQDTIYAGAVVSPPEILHGTVSERGAVKRQLEEKSKVAPRKIEVLLRELPVPPRRAEKLLSFVTSRVC